MRAETLKRKTEKQMEAHAKALARAMEKAKEAEAARREAEQVEALK